MDEKKLQRYEKWIKDHGRLSEHSAKQLIAEVRRLRVENKGLNEEYHLMMNATDYENVMKLQQENKRLNKDNDLLKALSPLMTTEPLEIEIEVLKKDAKLSIYYLKEFKARIPSDTGLFMEINKRIKNAEKALKGEGE
jgi:hypothetical protein